MYTLTNSDTFKAAYRERLAKMEEILDVTLVDRLQAIGHAGLDIAEKKLLEEADKLTLSAGLSAAETALSMLGYGGKNGVGQGATTITNNYLTVDANTLRQARDRLASRSDAPDTFLPEKDKWESPRGEVVEFRRDPLRSDREGELPVWDPA